MYLLKCRCTVKMIMVLFFQSCEKIIIEGKVDLKRTNSIVLDYPDVVEVPVLYIKSASVNTVHTTLPNI